jgi:DNA polymerase-3 subunit chi
MSEIRFYHLTRKSLEQALPELLSKAYSRGKRVVVRTENEKDVEKFNEILWTFNPGSFIPHGSKKDGEAALQPIWITEAKENPNVADTLFILGSATDEGIGDYELSCLIFEEGDEQGISKARERWKTYKDAGHEVAYWQQTEKGWENKGLL